MKATWPKMRTAQEELKHMRSIMRCYANSWREHREGMPAMARVELMWAITWRDRAAKFAAS